MKNEIYTSTGDFTGRLNGYNYALIKEIAPRLRCDGIELMLYSAWYADWENIINTIASYGLNIPVVHFDKEIGMHLAEHTARDLEEAKRKFTLNVRAAKCVGAKKAVFHLWGGKNSDLFLERSLALLPDFYRECEAAGVELLVENIPAHYHGPLCAWWRVREVCPNASFIYDTRFGEFHAEHKAIMHRGLWSRVKHIHVSSFERGKMEIWGMIRPILHPGEGCVDFPALVADMPEYEHSVTLESPAMLPSGEVDVEKLNRSLDYLAELFNK